VSKGRVCGELTIRELTPTHPSVTTFFEADVIGAEHRFFEGISLLFYDCLTPRGKWTATKEIDRIHWV
jgi:hypothetical protein